MKTNDFFLAAGIIRPFMVFVSDETCIGQLFDAHIYRMKIEFIISFELKSCFYCLLRYHASCDYIFT